MENRVHDLGRRVHSVCLVLRCVQFRATTDVGQSGQGRGEGRETRLGNREDYRGDATLTLATSALVSCLSALLSPILSYHSCYSYFSRRFSFFVFRFSFLVPTPLSAVQRDAVRSRSIALSLPFPRHRSTRFVHRRTLRSNRAQTEARTQTQEETNARVNVKKRKRKKKKRTVEQKPRL